MKKQFVISSGINAERLSAALQKRNITKIKLVDTKGKLITSSRNKNDNGKRKIH